MRYQFLVAYDISDPKRLSRVREVVAGYAISGQKSLYECYMTPTELKRFELWIRETIDPKVDTVHVFQLDPRLKCRSLGKPQVEFKNRFIIQ